MPEPKPVRRAKTRLRRGQAATTAAGELVREEIEHVRKGKHGARSTEQAIAIGLSKARRAGIPVAPPRKRSARDRTPKQAERDLAKGRRGEHKDPRRTRASKRALAKQPREAGSRAALSKHAKRVASARRR